MFKPIISGSLGEGERPELNSYNNKVIIHFDTSNVPIDENFDNIYIQIEPNEIINHYWVIQNYSKFKLILCWESNLLSLPNCKLFPFGTCWVDPNKNYSKEFGISHICSYKTQLPGHSLRQQVFNLINNFPGKKLNIRTPPRIDSKEILFNGFQYSVIIENIAKNNWFTEKLIDCLVTKTIPIYYGCPNINEFFDDSYFLKFSNIQELVRILQTINSENYYRLIEKIEYNRRVSLKYVNIWNRINEELDKIYA
jgi:hypothetical protein